VRIFLDTNALLAVILPQRQDERARTADWLLEHGRLTLAECVLVEACWVLQSVYGYPRRDIARALRLALESEDLMAWDPALADRALALMEHDPRLGIVDCILASRTLDGDIVCTFDRRLNRAIESL
jgi:predicted nucleic acid-binding protein